MSEKILKFELPLTLKALLPAGTLAQISFALAGAYIMFVIDGRSEVKFDYV